MSQDLAGGPHQRLAEYLDGQLGTRAPLAVERMQAAGSCEVTDVLLASAAELLEVSPR